MTACVHVSCSATVKGRRPLARDEELDYEVMSDEEWEEEPEGENLSVSLSPCLGPAQKGTSESNMIYIDI